MKPVYLYTPDANSIYKRDLTPVFVRVGNTYLNPAQIVHIQPVEEKRPIKGHLDMPPVITYSRIKMVNGKTYYTDWNAMQLAQYYFGGGK